MLVWQLCDGNGKTLRQGRIPVGTLPIGNGIALCNAALAAGGFRCSCRLRLVADRGDRHRERLGRGCIPRGRFGVPRDVLVTDRFGPS